MTTINDRLRLETELVENLILDVQNYKQLNPVKNKVDTVTSTNIKLPPVKSNYSDIEYKRFIEDYRKLHDTTFAVSMVFER